MKNLKILIVAGTVVAVAAIIAMIYLVASRTPANAPTTEQPDISTPNTNTGEQTTKTYTNPEDGFSFVYPNILQPGFEDPTYLPYGNYKRVLNEITLVHEIPVEYCAPSGKCEPTTRNMEIGSVVLNDSLTTIQSSNIGDQLVVKTFGSNQALVLSQGVEGEGIEYYFIAMPNQKVLMMYYKYINENVVLNYKTAKDFIPYAQQTEIAENIIKSIKFTN